MRRGPALLIALAGLALALVAGPLGTASAAEPAEQRSPAREAAYQAALVLAKGETVYVAPSQSRIFSRVQADQVRGRIIRAGGYPKFVAILPGNAASNDGIEQLAELTQLLDPTRRATIAVVTGGKLRAASTAIPYAQAQRLAEDAIEEFEGAPLEVVIAEFLGMVADEEARDESGGVAGVITGVLVTVFVFATGGIVMLRRRRRWRELSRLRPLLNDDIEALAREAATLPEPEASDVRVPLQQATQLVKRARGVEHLPAVAARLTATRRALAVSRSVLAGEVPAPDRAPCLFDGRHGASTADAEWSPPGGAAPRTVPVCAACAGALAAGTQPAAREVETLDGRVVPWFEAEPAYVPYLAPNGRDLLAGLPAGAPLRARRWLP